MPLSRTKRLIAVGATALGATVGLAGIVGFTSADAGPASLGLLYQQLVRQSLFLAFMDCFRVIGWLTITMIPLVFLVRKFKGGGGASTAH